MGHDGTKSSNEPMVKGSEPVITSDVMDVIGLKPFYDCVSLWGTS